MISLKKSIAEAEQRIELGRAALLCYESAVAATRDSVVEFDARVAAQYRTDLEALLQRVGSANDSALLLLTQKEFCSQLQQYQSSAQGHLKALREELEATTDALQEMVSGLSQHDCDSEAKLRSGLFRLRDLVSSGAVVGLVPDLLETINGLEQSIQEMQSTYRLTVVQMQDEINTLHRSIERANPRARPPQASAVGRDAENLIYREFESGARFRLLFIWIQNARQISHQFGGPVAAKVAAALAARLGRCLGATVSQWSADVTLGLLPESSEYSVQSLRKLPPDLFEPYLIRADHGTTKVVLRLGTGVVVPRQGQSFSQLMKACEDLVEAMRR